MRNQQLAEFLNMLQVFDMLPPQLFYVCLNQFKLNLKEDYKSIVLRHADRHKSRDIADLMEDVLSGLSNFKVYFGDAMHLNTNNGE